jgi:hypothetical protein
MIALVQKVAYHSDRARICKLLRSPGIDARNRFRQPIYVAWRAGTSNRVVLPARQAGIRFLGSFKGLQVLALVKINLMRSNNGISAIYKILSAAFARLCLLFSGPKRPPPWAPLPRIFHTTPHTITLTIPPSQGHPFSV